MFWVACRRCGRDFLSLVACALVCPRCRKRPHVRGCRAVDLMLGKS